MLPFSRIPSFRLFATHSNNLQKIQLASHQEIETYVLRLFKDYFRTANVIKLSLRSSFQDHGLDSLDGLELVTKVEDQLGIQASDDTLRTLNSVAAFMKFIKDAQDASKV
jgi:acyl carrier protein